MSAVAAQNGVEVNGSMAQQHDSEDFEESDEEEFDDSVPAHRRMTVTRVTDHAELADSVLSAQSAPTINLTHHQLSLPEQNIAAVIESSLKMENAH